MLGVFSGNVFSGVCYITCMRRVVYICASVYKVNDMSLSFRRDGMRRYDRRILSLTQMLSIMIVVVGRIVKSGWYKGVGELEQRCEVSRDSEV